MSKRSRRLVNRKRPQHLDFPVIRSNYLPFLWVRTRQQCNFIIEVSPAEGSTPMTQPQRRIVFAISGVLVLSLFALPHSALAQASVQNSKTQSSSHQTGAVI